MINTQFTHLTYLTVIDRGEITELAVIPTNLLISVHNVGGPKGQPGEPGLQGLPGQDGAANIPEVTDGGNF